MNLTDLIIWSLYSTGADSLFTPLIMSIFKCPLNPNERFSNDLQPVYYLLTVSTPLLLSQTLTIDHLQLILSFWSLCLKLEPITQISETNDHLTSSTMSVYIKFNTRCDIH